MVKIFWSVKETTIETSDDDIVDGAKSLAFPSISTKDFQFDYKIAANIIVASAIDFLRNPNHAKFRFVLIDSFVNSNMLDRVYAMTTKVVAEIGLPSLQLFIHIGDITSLFAS